MSKTALNNGFHRRRFDDMAIIINDRVDDPAEAGVERYVGLEHLDAGSLTIRRWGSPDDVEATKLRFRRGDIIFGRRRVYQRKVAVADFDGICSAHAMVLRAKPELVDPEFLPFFIQSDLFMERAKEISVGSLSPTINWQTLAREEFALPSLEEQKRLIPALTGARAVVETIIDARETGEKLRDSLLCHLYEKGTRTRRLVNTEIGPRPEGWKILPLGHRYEVQLGKMMSEAARTGDCQTPYLRNANVQWNRLDLSDIATMSFSQRDREKFKLEYGDILACEGRHVGKSALWREEIPGACYQKALHRLRRCSDDDDPEYLLHCLRYYSITGRFIVETGETTIPHLPAERLRAMLFPFPPIEEQKEIVSHITLLDAVLQQLVERENSSRDLMMSLTGAALGPS